ncbi:hypothetical protein DICPUDRAFT_88026 [Dictyostelium purpureum]|uniref:FNIP repeat-containing protein n=1 Tax=Dictyostelium purpureum TaxID=5786 RepID=F0ZLV9_DICPU|nr:uncharacterized protein DICPUDRAFT_88026 [Dictyostelium purpureum]EGC35096.1 hypothetical protein DICPUDRAFT_88026 [Dictyostelium purpureum]|eukprot:XP_003288403.1 hypothetical protein DICPUDRAFT_88026 [Dictyostelium purpureum]
MKLTENNNNLFCSVWTNKYIRQLILYYVKLYNIFFYPKFIKSLQTLDEFKYKEYLNGVEIGFNCDSLERDLPRNINVLNFSYFRVSSPIPSWIKSVTIPVNYDLSIFKNAKCLVSISLGGYGESHQEFNYKTLPESITELELSFYEHTIKKDSLPKNLKKLVMLKCSEVPFEEGLVLPESLTNLTSLRIADTNKSLEFTSLFKFPSQLVQLELCCKEIHSQLPNSLKKLKILAYFIKNDIIPPSLEYLYLKLVYQVISHQMIPKTVKSLEVSCNSFFDDQDISILPPNLERLVILTIKKAKRLPGYYFNKKLLPNQLPPTLKHLSFDDGEEYGVFNNGDFPLEDNVFPDSLTYLNLGPSFNKPVGPNTLPKSGNLKTVVFGDSFNRKFADNTIPSSVLTLDVFHYEYKHPIQIKNPNTIIRCKRNINLFYRPQEISYKSLRIPYGFDKPIKTLSLNKLQDLEYLEVSNDFNQELPPNLPIKKLVLGSTFKQTINLEHYQQLECLVVDSSVPNLTTTIYKMNSNNNINNNDGSNKNSNNDIFNFYNLKSIEVFQYNNNFISQLNPIFYQFIKIKKKNPALNLMVNDWIFKV